MVGISFLIVFFLVIFHTEGPWKKRNLADLGIVTQCIAPTKINDQYLTNVLLKINAKARFELTVFTTIISDSWLIKHLFHIWCFFAAGRHEFLFDYRACPYTTSDFQSPHYHYWDGCLSWLTWTSRCSIHCSGSKRLLLILYSAYFSWS